MLIFLYNIVLLATVSPVLISEGHGRSDFIRIFIGTEYLTLIARMASHLTK